MIHKLFQQLVCATLFSCVAVSATDMSIEPYHPYHNKLLIKIINDSRKPKNLKKLTSHEIQAIFTYQKNTVKTSHLLTCIVHGKPVGFIAYECFAATQNNNNTRSAILYKPYLSTKSLRNPSLTPMLQQLLEEHARINIMIYGIDNIYVGEASFPPHISNDT